MNVVHKKSNKKIFRDDVISIRLLFDCVENVIWRMSVGFKTPNY